MKLTAFRAFKSKFIKPCSKILSIFKLKLNSRFRRRRFRTKVVRFKKPFSLRKLHLPRCRPKAAKLRLKCQVGRRRSLQRINRGPQNGDQRFGVKIAELVSVFRSTRRSDAKEMEQVMMELKSVSDKGNGVGKEPFPSPITPAFVKANKKDGDVEEVDDACRSFESYLVEMIVEDGMLKDLVDVEELLQCTGSLNSPVFVDLVCRFYGDVCKDLFASTTSE